MFHVANVIDVINNRFCIIFGGFNKGKVQKTMIGSIMTFLTSANGALHKMVGQSSAVSVFSALVPVVVPCAGSSVWEAGCLESSSWL